MGYFLPFYPPNSLNTQNLKKLKNAWRYHLHMCTKNYDQIMYGPWNMVHDGQTDGWTYGYIDRQKKWHIEVHTLPKNWKKKSLAIRLVFCFILKPKITVFYLLSFVFSCCTTCWHSLSLTVTCCHSLSFIVICCTTRCHSLSLAVIRCTTNLSFYKWSSWRRKIWAIKNYTRCSK